MAPEQAEAAGEVDIRADLYSLGCTLYHLLAGQPPFGPPKFPTLTAKVVAHLHEPFPSIRLVRPDAPQGLEQLLTCLTAKARADRPQTPAQVIERIRPFAANADLTKLLTEETTAGAQPTAETGTVGPDLAETQAYRPCRSRLRPWHVLAAVAVVVTGSLIWGLAGLVRRPADTAVCPQVGRDAAHAERSDAAAQPAGPSMSDAPVSAPAAVQPEAPTEPSAMVDRATLFVRRDGRDETTRRLTLERGELHDGLRVEPLGPEDDFKLRAELSRPAYWYLVWFDTNGVVDVVAHSDKPETAVDYPVGSSMIGVNPSDPPGLHLLMLLVSDRTPSELINDLKERFADVGQPPDLPAGQYIQLRGFRGAGQVKSTTLDFDYIEKVEIRLPDGVNWVQQVYLPTEH